MKESQILYRMRVLPDQLERARRRVEMLEREAQRYGLTHLLTKELQHG